MEPRAAERAQRGSERARIQHIPELRLPNRLRTAEAPTGVIPKLRPAVGRLAPGECGSGLGAESSGLLGTKTLLGASSPFCFIAHFPDILKQPLAGRRRRRGEMMVWDGWWVVGCGWGWKWALEIDAPINSLRLESWKTGFV